MQRLSRVLLAATVGLLVAGCGDLTASSFGAEAHTVTVALASTGKAVHQFGSAAAKTAGATAFEGSGTDSDGHMVMVELQAVINYTSGSGEFASVLTLDFGDGNTVVAYTTHGVTTKTGDGAHVHALYSIEGGTGTYETATGTVSYVGDRTTALGGAVQSTFVASISH
jgi:hypothetical protein